MVLDMKAENVTHESDSSVILLYFLVFFEDRYSPLFKNLKKKTLLLLIVICELWSKITFFLDAHKRYFSVWHIPS